MKFFNIVKSVHNIVFKHRILVFISAILFIFLSIISKIYFDVLDTERRGIMTVSFLAVGQGDAILITTPKRHKIMIDTSDGVSSGSIVLSRMSENLNYFDRKIDLVVSTHAHADHIGGLPHIVDKYTLDYHVSNFVDKTTRGVVNLESVLNENEINQIILQAGDRIMIEEENNIYIDILWPTDQMNITDVNDSSIVTLLVYNNARFLMTGDAGMKIENYLVSVYDEKIEADVLKLGHHGSKTSTDESFLEKVSPKFVVVSAGKNNRYGHPHQEVIEKLEKYKKENYPSIETDYFMQSTIKNSVTFSSDGVNVWLD